MGYMIIGYYEGRSDILDTAKDEAEAEYLAREYALAFGQGWIIEWVQNR